MRFHGHVATGALCGQSKVSGLCRECDQSVRGCGPAGLWTCGAVGVDTPVVARFVLVHGAWHGGWCFEALVRELEALGHAATAPTLPCEDASLTQYDYARLIGPQPDAIVVGHSLGGLTIPLVEARARVYLAAILPIANVYDEAMAEGFQGTLRDDYDRSYWPDLETAATFMYPDCDRATAEWAYPQLRRQARLTPQSSPFGPDDHAVVCGRDAAVDPDWQRRAALEHLGRLFELDAGHSPFFTAPADLAEILDFIAR